MEATSPKLRGVNLGSWLLLEKWMVPSLFEGLAASDETTFCAELGPTMATERLRVHWDRWVTREDFSWIAERGLNAVRIPYGHWIFGPDYPWHRAYGEHRHPFATGGIEVLDRAMDWAQEFGLRVMLDLHAAPGCQNGFDNGGILNVCEWHTRPEYLEHALSVLERIAERYRDHPALHAIECLNEPRWDVPTDYLKDFYLAAYERIRRHCPADRVAVVFHDGFRSFREYVGFMQAPEYRNVIFDLHRYQCFDRRDIDSDIFAHMGKAGGEWREEADAINAELGLPAVCGEWSLGLDLRVVSLWAEGPFNHALEHMDEFQETVANRGYAAAQLLAFEKYLGWFFWSYKTETTPAWCFRDCVERGWLPSDFR
ncbi:glycoside hydrolase family 5 protein [Aromatoleum petrolei]|uniref:Exo-1,3-beta-glucanase D n=1 Tax=Aromatoleum petrolei TaxID=76116 RepID=A0ABX1MXS2_9RHOO|nr:glycoside hydrolase family 5 protein [Aromatoleum petrolei]NMF91106.1 cellulase family glycosylhydrolase [Aromatoleum petrolei]QTQ36330.1 Putative glucan 1,3-beta-glucosidase [Aromatoleum petrolei]